MGTEPMAGPGSTSCRDRVADRFDTGGPGHLSRTTGLLPQAFNIVGRHEVFDVAAESALLL